MKPEHKLGKVVPYVSTLQLLWWPVFYSCIEMMLLISVGALLAMAMNGGSENHPVWQCVFFALVAFLFYSLLFIRKIKSAQRLHHRILSAYPQPSFKLMFTHPKSIWYSIVTVLLVVVLMYAIMTILFFRNDRAVLPAITYILMVNVWMMKNYFAHADKAEPSMAPTRKVPTDSGINA